MGVPQQYWTKPSGLNTQLNQSVIEDLGIRALWCPEYSSDIGGGFSAPTYDRVHPVVKYNPADPLQFVAGRVADDETGPINNFLQISEHKSKDARAWQSSEQVCRPTVIGAGDYFHQTTLFAVASTTATGALEATIVRGPFTMGYKASTNEMFFIFGTTKQFRVLPTNGADGKMHTWAISFDSIGAAPRVSFFFDGENLGTSSGAFGGQSDSFLLVGAKNAAAVAAFSGNISLAGYAAKRWKEFDFSRFATSPFEMLYPDRRYMEFSPPPPLPPGQIDARFFSIAPVVAAMNYQVEAVAAARTLSIVPAIGSEEISVEPVTAARALHTLPVVGADPDLED